MGGNLVIDLLLSLALTAYATLTEPQWARCPSSYVVGGVTPDGTYRCVHDLIGDEDAPLAFRPPGVAIGRVYCSSGTVPVQVGELGVACRAGRYQW